MALRSAQLSRAGIAGLPGVRPAPADPDGFEVMAEFK